VVGAGVAGLAVGARLAALGHEVTVFEQADAPGGKAGRRELDGYRFDTGPSLLTLPDVLRDTLAATGADPAAELDLVPVEPVTRYRFADGSSFDMSADEQTAAAALEGWSPGSGADWRRFLAAGRAMWAASERFLGGPPPWPPRRPRPGEGPPDPRDLLRARPWQTLRGLARAHARDPRLQMVIERFATYAGGDPRRAPAALALAGWVEHAFGAWHVRGGLGQVVAGLVRRLEAAGGELRCGAAVGRIDAPHGRVAGVRVTDEWEAADAVVFTGDAASLGGLTGDVRGERHAGGERSLSGFALMLAVEGPTEGIAHHSIFFPADYDAEFDDVFAARRPVRDPTLYVAVSAVSDPGEAPPGGENWFVLANAPTHRLGGPDWDREADAYEEKLLGLLARRGLEPKVVARARRTPADLERETGAPGGAIYGRAPHGRLAALRRPGNRARRTPGLYLAGGTVHPGGGLPLVLLSAKIVAEEIGPA
jgi:phytoene desaturase